jgi:hypothetical protein
VSSPAFWTEESWLTSPLQPRRLGIAPAAVGCKRLSDRVAGGMMYCHTYAEDQSRAHAGRRPARTG